MKTHSSIFAWRTPWTEDPSGLYSPWGHKESEKTEQLTFSLCPADSQMPSNLITCRQLSAANNPHEPESGFFSRYKPVQKSDQLHNWTLTEDQAKSYPDFWSTETVWNDKHSFYLFVLLLSLQYYSYATMYEHLFLILISAVAHIYLYGSSFGIGPCTKAEKVLMWHMKSNLS